MAESLVDERKRSDDDRRVVFGSKLSEMKGRNVQCTPRGIGRTTYPGTMRPNGRRGASSVVDDKLPIGDEWECTTEGTDAEQREVDTDNRQGNLKRPFGEPPL